MEHMGLNNAAIYCRFSKDDGQIADSSSIQTQKSMLERYCHEQGFAIVDVYADDGYTGLNYDRPDFNRMLTDIDNGRVNTVITKDLSRLGRDYIQTGYYTEFYFPRKKVRYIAVNDNIDTNKEDNDIAPFKNILNDFYSRDLSRKIKSAKRQRAYSGYFISAQTPYGYKVDPANKNRLAIDDEPARVVREMFRLALAGNSTVQITKILTERKIPTPSAYKVCNGDTRFTRQLETNGEFTWCNGTVQTILRDRVYAGDMENHKYEVVNYKTKEYRAVPKEQHIIVENTHEPLVIRDDYNRVQELIKQRHKPKKHNFGNVFKSLVFCKSCGYRLTFTFKYNRKGETTFPYLVCRGRYKDSEACPKYNQVYYDALYDEVLKRIRAVAKGLDDGSLLQSVNKRLKKQIKTDKLEAEKVKINARFSSLGKITKQLYEDYACGKLDIDSYQAFLSDYQNEQKQLSQRLNAIETELNQKDEYTENLQKLSTVIKEYLNIEKLTANMLNQLVERIEVGYPEAIDGEIQQEINIIYRFIKTTL